MFNYYLMKKGKKLYGWCKFCGNNVRLNKPFVGAMHVCFTNEQKMNSLNNPSNNLINFDLKRGD